MSKRVSLHPLDIFDTHFLDKNIYYILALPLQKKKLLQVMALDVDIIFLSILKILSLLHIIEEKC